MFLEEGFTGTTGLDTGGSRKSLMLKIEMAFWRRDATHGRKRCNGLAREMRRFGGRVETLGCASTLQKLYKTTIYGRNGRDVTPYPTHSINGCFGVHFCRILRKSKVQGGRDVTQT
jgi:hypothetical protein